MLVKFKHFNSHLLDFELEKLVSNKRLPSGCTAALQKQNLIGKNVKGWIFLGKNNLKKSGTNPQSLCTKERAWNIL